jgi:hypothetical protein
VRAASGALSRRGGDEGRTLAWENRLGTLKGAVLKPVGGCRCAGRVSGEPAGQRSEHLAASPMTAAARLRLNHCSTAPGETQASQIPEGPGHRTLTWPNTTPPQLTCAPTQIGAQALQPATMISAHTA